jgi:ribosomal protein L21
MIRSALKIARRQIHHIRAYEKPWQAPLDHQDRSSLLALHNSRRWAKKMPPAQASTTLDSSELVKDFMLPQDASTDKLDDKSKESLTLISNQGKLDRLYAIIELQSRPYSVTLNDVLLVKRMPGTEVGDIVSLTRVKEIGSKSYYLRAANTADTFVPQQLVRVKALVMEHPVSSKYTTYRRRLGKGPGDRKWRKRSYRDSLTMLRVTDISINESVL